MLQKRPKITFSICCTWNLTNGNFFVFNTVSCIQFVSLNVITFLCKRWKEGLLKMECNLRVDAASKRCLWTYQFIAEEDKASVFVGLGIFGDETKKSLFSLVVGTVRYPMQRIFVKHFFAFRFLNCDSIDGNGQFGFGRFSVSGTRFWLFELLIKFQFLDALFHDFNSFGLIDFYITKKLKKKKRGEISIRSRCTFEILRRRTASSTTGSSKDKRNS